MIVVTGGAGFVGSNLVERLVPEDEVVCLDNYSSGVRNIIEGCRYVECDLADADLGFLDGEGIPKCIVHLAATARIQPSFSDPKRYWRNNCDATISVLEYARKRTIPVVYAGSSSHHGGRFKNPYTFTKDIGEDLLLLYRECFGVRSSVVRLYNVYGPREATDESYSTLIGRWKRRREEGLPLEVYGDGSKERDFTHVDDIVDAIVKIIEMEAYGHCFELGRGEPFSVNQILSFFGADDVRQMPDKKGEVPKSIRQNDLAREILGWNPTRSIKDYITSVDSRGRSGIAS